MENDFIRITIRYPKKYEGALQMVREEKCISKNAVIIQAIREFAENAAGGLSPNSAPAAEDHTDVEASAQLTIMER